MRINEHVFAQGHAQNVTGAFGCLMTMLWLSGSYTKHFTETGLGKGFTKGQMVAYAKAVNAQLGPWKKIFGSSIGQSGTAGGDIEWGSPVIKAEAKSKIGYKAGSNFGFWKELRSSDVNTTFVKTYMDALCQAAQWPDKQADKKYVVISKMCDWPKITSNARKLRAVLAADDAEWTKRGVPFSKTKFMSEMLKWYKVRTNNEALFVSDIKVGKVWGADYTEINAQAKTGQYSRVVVGGYNSKKGAHQRWGIGFNIVPKLCVTVKGSPSIFYDAIVDDWNKHYAGPSTYASSDPYVKQEFGAKKIIGRSHVWKYLKSLLGKDISSAKISAAVSSIKKGKKPKPTSKSSGEWGKAGSSKACKAIWTKMLEDASIDKNEVISIGTTTLKAKEFVMKSKNFKGNWSEIIQLVDNNADLSSYKDGGTSEEETKPARRRATSRRGNKLTGSWSGVPRTVDSRGRLSKDLTKNDQKLFDKWRARSGTRSKTKDRKTFAALANPPNQIDNLDWIEAKKESKQYSIKYALLEMAQTMLPFASDDMLQIIVDDIETGEYTVADFLEFSGLTDNEIFPEEDTVYTQEEQMAEEAGFDGLYTDSSTDPII